MKPGTWRLIRQHAQLHLDQGVIAPWINHRIVSIWITMTFPPEYWRFRIEFYFIFVSSPHKIMISKAFDNGSLNAFLFRQSGVSMLQCTNFLFSTQKTLSLKPDATNNEQKTSETV